MTELKYIICFYLIKNSNNKYIPHMSAFYQYLGNLETDNFNYANINTDTIFFKSVHLVNETGVFIFYNINYCLDTYAYAPIIEFKAYDFENTIFIDHFTDENVNKLLLCDLDFYDSNYFLNDFIKISYHKLCLISTSLDKKQLFITIINILEKIMHLLDIIIWTFLFYLNIKFF